MSLTVLLAAGDATRAAYRPALAEAFRTERLEVQLVTEAAPETVDYIIYGPASPVEDFRPFTRTRAVLSLWAGVEKIVTNPTLTQPLARMVDPALTAGMVEYVCGHVLRYHLGLDRHLHARPGDWDPTPPPLAHEREVTVLGLGELGAACAHALVALGFRVRGWSRTRRDLPGILCHHGDEGLKNVLQSTEIIVTLLPHTEATEGLLDADRFTQMPPGTFLINPGRGALIDDDALLAALERGIIAGATLDVFREEPLPRDHPFWAHPAVTVTPHIAAATRADSAARVIARNIARVEAGKPLLHEVDRGRGY